MTEQMIKRENSNPSQIDSTSPTDSGSRKGERKRIYVELCGSSEDISGFLNLCADNQVKMIVHWRSPLPQDQQGLSTLHAK